MKYKQLDLVQRYQIEAYVKLGISQTKISQLIGVNRSTISREFKRNIGLRGLHSGVYRGAAAHQKAWQRHHTKHKRTKLTQEMKQQMKYWLEIKRLSPELIAIEWKHLGVDGIATNGYTSGFGTARKAGKSRTCLIETYTPIYVMESVNASEATITTTVVQ